MTKNNQDKKGNFPEFSCACQRCVAMCKHYPCLPTVDDAQAIVNAGYADKLAVDKTRLPFVMLRGKRREDGSCVFLENDRCILHDKGLKPTEGRCVDHAHSMQPWWYSMVYRDWKKRGGELLKLFD